MRHQLIIIAALFAAAIASMSAVGCSSYKDEPSNGSKGKLELVTVEYTYKVDPEMLSYFNIDVIYLNQDSVEVTKPMTVDSIVIRTASSNFPSRRWIKFDVTRRGSRVPEETPHWTTSMRIVCERYYDDNVNDRVISSTSTNYSPRPAQFDSWAETFIARLAVGYETAINFNGSINSTTD